MKTTSLAAVLLGLAVEQVSASIAITGATGGVNTQTGERPARQDIRKLAASGPAWDLYIQALVAYQQADQWDPQGHFQLAGIHGAPNLPWDGVQGNTGISGFCAHGSILFTTWHRPYIAIVEQSVMAHAVQIAQTYPDNLRDQYVQAAQTLRLPYWDWSVSPTMPDQAFFSAMTINGPNGQETIPNPLYNYRFHPYASWETGNTFSQYDYTIRGQDGSVQAETNVDSALSGYASMLHESTYNILTSAQDFAQMSSTGVNINGNGYNSLENMHNIIHGTIGGHMGFTTTAAFDPIFWLHHVNVDRIFAMWQAIHPDAYVTPSQAPGTSWIKPGSPEDVNTQLAPFHKDTNGNFFTSNDVRSTRTFGYTYPEIQDWGVDANTLAANVRTTVNNIYNPQGSNNNVRTSSQKPPTKKSPHHRREQQSFNASNHNPYSGNSASYQWAISYQADPVKVGKSLLLQFYWKTEATEAAAKNSSVTAGHFKNSTSVAGKTNSTVKAKDYSDIIGVGPIQVLKGTGQSVYNGQTPITGAVLKVVPNGNYTATLGWLKDNLKWKGQWFDGSDFQNSDLADNCVNITIIGRQVVQTADASAFPVYYNWTAHDTAPLGSVGNGSVVQPCNCAPAVGADTKPIPTSAVVAGPTPSSVVAPSSVSGAKTTTSPSPSPSTGAASTITLSTGALLLAAMALFL